MKPPATSRRWKLLQFVPGWNLSPKIRFSNAKHFYPGIINKFQSFSSLGAVLPTVSLLHTHIDNVPSKRDKAVQESTKSRSKTALHSLRQSSILPHHARGLKIYLATTKQLSERETSLHRGQYNAMLLHHDRDVTTLRRHNASPHVDPRQMACQHHKYCTSLSQHLPYCYIDWIWNSKSHFSNVSTPSSASRRKDPRCNSTARQHHGRCNDRDLTARVVLTRVATSHILLKG